MARKVLHGNVVATEEGEKMGQNRFQLDEEKADLDKDGQLSSYERARGEAVQKAMAEDDAPGLMMGGMMMESDPFAPLQVVVDIDEASGNEVPAGSKDEEVRDDIPALLSEGEYVVPADVVRYHGLKTFEELRCEAKHALGLMAMHDRISMVDEDTKEPVEYDIEEKDAPKVEKTKVKVVEAAEGTTVQSGYQISYITDPVTGEVRIGYVDPVTGEEIAQEDYDPSLATQYTPEKILESISPVDKEEEKEQEELPACPPGYQRDPQTNTCVPIVKGDQDNDDNDDDDDPGRGTLGLTEEEIDDIFSELSPEYKELMDEINQPPGVIDAVVPGALAVKTVVNGIRKTSARTDVRNLIREGKNIGITPSTEVGEGFDKSYADWRNSLDVAGAAAIAISEKEAQNVSSDGGGDWRTSSFGSQGEADAVAKHGSMSDQVFDEIEKTFNAGPPTQKMIDDYNKAEAKRAAEEGRPGKYYSDGSDNDDQTGSGVGNQGEDKDDDNDPYGGREGNQDDKGNFGFSKGGMPSRKNTPKVAMIKY